ncbi:MAG: M3 family metallopeptidase, partial [Paraprevotella sp.]|nr:M3 family metallopeptidase [Paraprevotella sp.]
VYDGFVRGGANLDSVSQAKLRELNIEISSLQTTFGENMLKETNAFRLVVDKKEDLAGLPDGLVAVAAETAKACGESGKWVFTLHNPSVMPFLQYADNRELREQIFKGYINRGNNWNDNDNKTVCARLVAARLEKAKLMGYEDYASFVLETRMAKTSAAVYDLLYQVWTPALAKAKAELDDIKAEIKKDGKDFEPEGWDWRYYADRAKKAKYDFDESTIRPYLKLENVRDGMFLFANKLYGVTFETINEIPLPHPDAIAYEAKDKDGSHLGVLYFDFFPRESKRGGAWCSQYRAQTYKDGKKVAPVVTIVCNFTKPSEGNPALLTPDEATTMFHEFGHALHNLFRDVHYYGISRVPRDFVELPSQVNEHWTFEPELLKEYAKHYQTNELIPDELVERFNQCGKYGQGFATTEYVAASLLDMDFHSMNEIPAGFDVMDFEQMTLAKQGLLRQIPARYRTTYFNHTMGGGYTAGYYSYLWSEILDADAFEAYKETGDIFNAEVAEKFRRYVLQPGAIDDAMVMYVNFRGKEPNIDPLLKNRGLK